MTEIISDAEAQDFFDPVVDKIGTKTGTAVRLIVQGDIEGLNEYINHEADKIRDEIREAFTPEPDYHKYAVAVDAGCGASFPIGTIMRVIQEENCGDKHMHLGKIVTSQNKELVGIKGNFRTDVCAHLSGGHWVLFEADKHKIEGR